MLAPKRIKFRKWQKGRLRGPATRGADVAFGDIGLKAVINKNLFSLLSSPCILWRRRFSSGLAFPAA